MARYTLHPISPTQDLDILTTLSLSATINDPLYHLTYPSSTVSSSALHTYHLKTKIDLPDLGNSKDVIKVVDNSLSPAKIAGFCSWDFGPREKEGEEGKEAEGESEEAVLREWGSELPGADTRFILCLWEKLKVVVGRVEREGDISSSFHFLFVHHMVNERTELLLMRIAPAYQRRGLGGMLLQWGLDRAREEGRRIICLAGPEGWKLYEKFGFRNLGEVEVNLEEFGGEEAYVHRVIVWDPREN
jgi:GNAT superfamily N-acetyltransferase